MVGCCFMCRKRTLGCHGKDENGNWRCREWGEEQERKEAQRQQRQEQYLMSCYLADFRKEKMQQEKAHKSYRGKG